MTLRQLLSPADFEDLHDATCAEEEDLRRKLGEARADLDALRLEREGWNALLEDVRRDRDEARAVFRDAVHMMAHIARAAGFDPEDPIVEPPAIAARVARLWTACDEARARLATLTAPADGVNIEGVLQLDARYERACRRADSTECAEMAALLAGSAPALAREVVRLRAEAAELRRILESELGITPTDGRRHSPLLSLTPHLMERIRALGFVPGECGVLPWLVWEAEELRLTLAAELGQPEGGADLDFAQIAIGRWRRNLGGGPNACDEIERDHYGSDDLLYRLTRYPDGEGSTRHATARAAMHASHQEHSDG